MEDLIRYVADQLRTADTFPALLAAAHLGLELAERAARSLAAHAPETSYPAYAAAEAEAIAASEVLSAAPSLSPPGAELAAQAAHSDFAANTAALALAIARALVTAAERTTHAGDRITCLEAAMHTERVCAALR